MNSAPQIPVAIFLTSFDPGGTERQMTELIRRLDDARFRVHVVCLRKEGAWLPKVTSHAASVVEFRISGFARLATALQIWRFAQWCRRERIAVLHTCDFYSNIFGLVGGALARVPVRIGSRRELNPDKTERQIRLQRLAYRFASRVVANSPAAAAILRTEGVPSSAVVMIPNGVDASAYPEKTDRSDVRKVITVANLRPEKNHETLIAAAAQLASSCPNLRYQIVGEGSRRAILERLAAKHRVTQIVDFLGHREDVPALLAAADIFVLPSRSEAFPNGAIEAMAAGLPVVASAVGGLLDLVETGRTGILVPPSDPEPLAVAIRSLYEDPQRAREMGRQARREVRAQYSFERMVA
ncbi:MAG: glycosyltransferase, partial [Acidobacteria bacterium]|nr:glycosyltransferase [Acidobacteriota bacterium]